MTNGARRSGWRPTFEQELLLRAALLEGDAALRAWREWASATDVQTLDAGSNRLLPLLYRNLTRHNVQDPLMPRLKGVYRHTWASNKVLFHRLRDTLTVLEGAGIHALLLKGAAIVPIYYGDYGLRPMDDFDVLVRPHDGARALDLLLSQGWTPKYEVPRSRLPLVHGLPLLGPNHEHLDLHWHIFAEPGVTDDSFWTAAVAMQIEGLPSQTLAPADQLLHTCVHGARWNVVPSIRWIADAALIIRHAEATAEASAEREIDWDRLITQARRWQFNLTIHEALTYLRDTLELPIPDSCLRRLKAAPVSALEQAEYRLKRHQSAPWTLFQFHRQRYARLTEGKDRLFKVGYLPAYLQQWWGIRRWWTMPPFVVVRVLREIGPRPRQDRDDEQGRSEPHA